MKKNSQKILSVILSMLMILSVLPLAVTASAADEAPVSAANAPVYALGYGGLGSYAAPMLGEGEEGEGGGADVSVPAQFSLVDSMPAARDQNPYGSCWAFGTLASVESNLITQGIVEDPDDIDLSEMQLIYYMYHPTVDPLGNITPGEGSYRSDDELIDGGRSDYAMNVLSHWNGIASENDHANFAYGVYGSNVSALEGDWDPSLATEYNDYILKGYYAINLADADQLKAAIIENGAAATGYTHFYNSIYTGTDVDTGEYTVNYYSGKEPSYSNNGVGGGHAVAIVGWDDNYAKENFGGDFQPENDGAWLIRNSWGADWGMGGYFWMSYEEKTMDSTAFIAIMQTADAYDNNYFYDGGSIYYPSAKVLGAVNKFTAKGSEILRAVSVVFPEDTEVSYTVDIYLNPADNDFLKNEEPVAAAHTEGVTTFAGMYTIPLASPVALKDGDVFAVVIRADKAVTISYDKYSNYDHGWFVNNVTWEDDSSYFINGSGGLTSMEERGVARIKAYTDTVDSADEIAAYNTEVTASEIVLGVGDTAAIADHLTVSPEDAVLTFACADEAVAAVEGGTVTAIAEGETEISVFDGNGVIKAGVPVSVHTHDYTLVPAADPDCTQDGCKEHYTCSVCDKLFVLEGGVYTAVDADDVTLEAEGHKFDDTSYTEAVAAGVYTAGSIGYYTCLVCGDRFAEIGGDVLSDEDIIIPALHTLTFVAAVEPTCSKAGNVDYYYYMDGETKVYVLADAEAEEGFTAVKIDEETGDEVALTVEDVTLAAAHTLVKTDAVDADCVNGTRGNIEYYTCEVCGKYFTDENGENEIAYSKTITYPKHDLTRTAAKAATCTDAGNVEYYTCGTCGRYFKYQTGSTELQADDLVIPAKGHSLRKIEANEASCTVDGNIEYYVCKTCEKLFSDAEGTNEISEADTVLEASGHDYQGEETEPATCVLPGLMTYTCANGCGSSYTEIIPPTGHNFVDGVCTGCGMTIEQAEAAETEEAGGPICEYCGRRHGTSWFADFLYAVHRVFKAIKDVIAKFSA